MQENISIVMRDGVVLKADLYRPQGEGHLPVLIYRTPYGKADAARDYRTHLKAVARGYAVLLQDVRGRYTSQGIFEPYRHEGADGFDTIEWAAKQPWCNGRVGTYGLSYPGAVQWLAAVESPPHLQAMVPAMTFSSPRDFFYMNGVFDTSWLPWIYLNVAPDARSRMHLPGTRDGAEAEKLWPAVADAYVSYLPLGDLPYLRREAPFYFEWLRHPPEDTWWDWAELRGRYQRVSAAVLNLSGWYDEAYGPEGATTNFRGLLGVRRVAADGSSGRANHLLIGPWVHGVSSTGERRTGELDFGPLAAVDYDAVVLDFFDHYLRNVENEVAQAPPVRYFVMGANEWRTATQWPPPTTVLKPLYLHPSKGRLGTLSFEPPSAADPQSVSSFVSDPKKPVNDPHPDYGPHDYQSLVQNPGVLTFETAPLSRPLLISGNVIAEINASCDCNDFDLWVRLQDVYPDGRAFNLMSPGNDVLRASYRRGNQGALTASGAKPQSLVAGKVYLLRLPALITSMKFAQGHRLRIQLSGSFAPHLSRNLQTGDSETRTALSKVARITIHHSNNAPSRLLVPVDGPAEDTRSLKGSRAPAHPEPSDARY